MIRIAADPNNLPFSNEKLEGFENKIAALVAKDLNADLEYVWRAQRRGFFRHALKDAEADLVLGAPAGFDRALTTPPYYRSTYVFVARPGTEGAKVRSLDDPLLKWLKVGVQLIGDDGANTPPAHALAARGAVDNLVGFTVYGDYAEPNPPARIVSAVAKGDVDVAVVWGPLAGYFAGKQDVPLQLTPVSPEADAGGLRFTFSIAMGVQKPDKALRDELAGALERRRAEVGRILDEYHVPRLPSAARPASRPAEARDAK
ncbi:MAG TPA: quinoprotein dehydrogenase-associated putative ABC transporter substrate-binding protein [Humisphaera sp.]